MLCMEWRSDVSELVIDASACYTSFEKLHLGTQFGTVVDSGVMPLDWIESSTEADLLCGVVTSRSNLPPSLPKLVISSGLIRRQGDSSSLLAIILALVRRFSYRL